MHSLLLVLFCLSPVNGDPIQTLIENDPFSPDRINAEEITNPSMDQETLQFHINEATNQEEANLLMLQLIDGAAQQAGVKLNSINTRKARSFNDQESVQQVRTYFGYDSDLESLIALLQILENQDVPVAITNLTISARQRPNTKLKNKQFPDRAPLNGNAIITALYPADASVIAEHEALTYLGNKGTIIDVLVAISAALPKDAYLTHLQIKDGNILTIQGKTNNGNEVYQSLSEIDLIKDINPGNFTTNTSSTSQRFMYKATLNFKNF